MTWDFKDILFPEHNDCSNASHGNGSLTIVSFFFELHPSCNIKQQKRKSVTQACAKSKCLLNLQTLVIRIDVGALYAAKNSYRTQHRVNSVSNK